MPRPKQIAASELLAAPPGQYPLSDKAVERAVDEWYRTRLERRQKQHERLCVSAGKVPRADLANAASKLLLELMEAKEVARMQRRVIQALNQQSAQIGSEAAVMEERLKMIDDAKKRTSDARHAKDRENKLWVVRYYQENRAKYPSKDAAAEAMSKMVHVGRLTVRKWLINV